MIRRPEFTLNFAAATDIGCGRRNNEDSFGYDGDLNLYVVCDGMGGHAAGEVASGIAVRTLIESFDDSANADPNGDIGLSDSAAYGWLIEQRLASSIEEANRQVRAAAATDSTLYAMGTTLVCALLDGSRFVVGNVGDSRAYLIRDSVCAQITLDHSFVAEQVRNGLMTQQMANESTRKSDITRNIGGEDIVEPDLFAVELQSGDMLLLASDGLTRYAEPEDIVSAASPTDELPVICQRLIDYAKNKGGEDNITCILLRVIEMQEAGNAVIADGDAIANDPDAESAPSCEPTA